MCPKSHGKSPQPGKPTPEVKASLTSWEQVVVHSHLHSLQKWTSCACACGVRVCVVCTCVCACVAVVSGVDSRGQPGASLGFQQRRPRPGRIFRESSSLWLPQGLPRPSSSQAGPGPAAGLQSGGSAPSRPACNRIVYVIPPSRNKTTESNIANRCLRPGPVVPARCSFEHPGRGEAWRPVPPDAAGWGGDCCWNWRFGGPPRGFGEQRGEEITEGKGAFFFSFIDFPHVYSNLGTCKFLNSKKSIDF